MAEDPENAAEYLTAIMEEDDLDALLLAIRDVAKAQGGMGLKLERHAGEERPSVKSALFVMGIIAVVLFFRHRRRVVLARRWENIEPRKCERVFEPGRDPYESYESRTEFHFRQD